MYRMIERSVFVCVFSVVLAGSAGAQIQGADALSNIDDLASGSSMFRSFDNRFKGVVGTPTYLETYKRGLIQATSGKWFTNDSVNYDAYNDDLLVKRLGAEAIVSKGMVKQFVLLDKDSIRFVRKELPDGKITFVRVIVDDHVRLLAREIKLVSEPTNSGAYSSGRSHREFESKTIFLVETESGLAEIRTKKDLSTAFQSRQSEADAFIKKHKINIKKEQDMRDLVQYINKLS
jgi:hypothetical protein